MPHAATAAFCLRVFGPFQAERDGQPLPRLRSRKGHWILALLVLRYGREVERAWLAGTLWPESPTSQALANLRNSLLDLRRALGPEAGRLLAPSPLTLALDLSGAVVDLLAFDAAAARDDSAALEQAVSLYRGPLLEGCVEEWVVPERQAREEAYLRALETLAERAQAAGDAERYLRRAVAVDPLRESAQRALMQALAAGGSYATALLVYRELRHHLHRELNAAPDAETQTLFEQLRREARRLAAKSSGEGLGGRAGVSRHPPTSWVPAGASEREPPPLLPHNLPRPLTRFIGREREMAAVQQLLADSPLLTLTGSGGCGKTRLALQVAAERVEDSEAPGADGVWWVELAALADPGLVPQTVASALGLREEPGRPLTQTLRAYLRAKHLLLVLDNCEHLLPACAPLADTLLRACPGLRILATSRAGLGVSGEQTYRVPSLSVPGVQVHRSSGVQEGLVPTPEDRNTQDHRQRQPAVPPEDLMSFEAVQLFVDRARLSEATFAVTPANAPAVLQVCQRLDGIPLAIELAAARVKALPVEQIAERLDDMFRLLTGGSRTALPRQQTLRASLDWSYHLLSEAERTLLRRLSVFAGGWTLAAAEAVGAEDGIARGEVLDYLSQLVEKSLALHQPVEGEARYRLLETVQQYAGERLAERGEAEAVRERHEAFYLQLAEAARAAAGEGKGTEAFERLEPEHDNLRAALAWALEAVDSGQWLVASPAESGSTVSPPSPELITSHQPLTTALRLAGALGEFWCERGYWDEGRQWLERALAGAPGAEPTAERARALAVAGQIATYQADYPAARNRLEESIALCRALGDTRGLVEALAYLTELMRWEGNGAVARAVQEEGVALARTVGNPRLLALALSVLGQVTGEPETARAVLEESLAFARRVGDRGLMSLALHKLGDVFNRQGEGPKARELLEESVELARAAKNKGLLFWAIFHLVGVRSPQGDSEQAKSLSEEALQLARELRNPGLVGRAIRRLVEHGLPHEEALPMVEQAAAEYGPEVVRYVLPTLVAHAPSWEEALRMIQQAAAEYGPEVVRRALGALVVRAPSDEEALRRIDRAAREYGPEAAIHPLGALGHAARERGDYEGAAAWYRRSLVLRQEVGDTFAIAQSLEDFACLAARQQQWERAARLWGVAETISGVTPPLGVSAEYGRAVQGARGALGEGRFAAAWAAGRALALEDAIAIAVAAEESGDALPPATGRPSPAAAGAPDAGAPG